MTEPIRMPVVGDRVIYFMTRKLASNSPVDAIVTATSAEDIALSVTQIRIYVHGKKNQHPSGPVDYGNSMCQWRWPDQDQAQKPVERARLVDPELGDMSDCIATPEEDEARLVRIENRLAARLNLDPRMARSQLMILDKAGKLVEDELVAGWHDAYSWWIHR